MEEAHGTQLTIGSVLAGYRIDASIGRGGMGSVYRVTNIALHRVYALKVLPPQLAGDESFRERFRREMRIAASLEHPNIVAIHNAGEHDGLLYLVMDYIDGTDLRAVVRQSGAMAPERATQLLTQVAAALDASHAHGLVHRDIKPANILVAVRDGEERAYLTDFGLARKLDSASSIEALTKTGVVVGTVHYMSPEQITGNRIDARSDIYALGCVFFEMLTGTVPYERDNSLATLYAHVHDPPPSPTVAGADVDPALDSVLARAMSKSPDDRYASAGDFARDAAAALYGVRYTGPQTSVAVGDAAPAGKGDEERSASAGTAAAALPSGRHAPRRYRWLALAGAVIVVCGGVAAVIALTSGGSSRAPAATFTAPLRPVPLNRVTASGSASVRVTGDSATIIVDTAGLIAAPHLMHIHGGKGRCPAATDGRPYRGHLVVGAAEGNAVYGGIVTSLTEHGSTSPGVDLSASLYASGPSIRYRRTVQLGSGVANLIKNGLAVIVVHGIDYDGTGRYDTGLGRDPQFGNLPVEESAPALCGPLVPAQMADVGGHSGGAVYVATLRLYSGSSGAQDSGVVFLCHPPPSRPTGLADLRRSPGRSV